MNTTSLTQSFATPFQSFPFDTFEQADFESTITEYLQQAKEEINAIANNQAEPTFENTIAAMEYNGKMLGRYVEAFFNIHSAETNDVIEAAAERISPMLAAFSNDILLNENLFKRVQKVNEQSNDHLNIEQKRLLEKTYKGFVRNGALLNEHDKEKLREIDQQLALVRLKFSQNVLNETNAYRLHLKNEKDIMGLPESALRQAKELAIKEQKEGYLFTLQYPSYVPFMQYAANREHRKELYIAYNQRAAKHNEYNNEEVIKQIVNLKQERAKLLGYPTHADFVLEERMAKSPDKVLHFLNDLLEKARPFAQKEIVSLKEKAAKDGVEKMMPYDHSYYAEKLREEKYDYNEEALKPYFALDKVLEAAFGLAEKLFGLKFVKVDDVAVYHQEVRVYNVLENDQHKALLYTDFFPREGKRAGAWMTSFAGQYINHHNENIRPHVSIVCNFSRPVGDTPSLLTFNEVTTLFHEFGHALHGIMADTFYESLSGTNVFWDFVELPSQFLENYCFEKAFLQTFARHWQTGETLDEATIDKIVNAANFMEGYQTLRQLSFGLLDMAYYTHSFNEDDNIAKFEQEQTAPTKLYPLVSETVFSTAFSHIFAGGYDAGYYSYKCAEVLDADAFAYFKENGIFNKQIAEKYKVLISSGGTMDPAILYKNFRGKEATVDALLMRAGLLEK